MPDKSGLEAVRYVPMRIHVFDFCRVVKTWMPATRRAKARRPFGRLCPGMTTGVGNAFKDVDGIDVLFAACQPAAAFGDLLSSANSAISARLMAACRVGELICAPIRSVT